MKPISLPASLRRLAPLTLVLVSAAIAVGAYLQALDAPFISDDIDYIPNNPKLIGLRFFELWRLLVEPFNIAPEFLPLRELSFWFDITLFGMNPAAFRIHNIILYLLCLPLVYATTLGLWRYFASPADAASAAWAAAVVSALFALHPTLVEPVVWISGRKYLLPNLFAMLALWLAVSARREHGLSPAHAAAALVAFVAMMLSKTSYFPVAAIIALLWVIFWRDIPAPYRRRTLLLWPLAILLLAAAMVLIFIAIASSSQGSPPFYFGIEAVTRTLAVLGWLARLAVSPEGRHFYYPVFEDPWFPVMVALGVAVLAAAAWGAVMLLRRRSLAGFALVAFLLLCLPYLQLIPYSAPTLVSDRFLSLAVWPVMLLVVSLAWRLKPVSRTVLLLVIALPLVFQTIERPRDWRSYEALIDTDLRAYPGYYPPAIYKSLIQLSQGLYGGASETANSITDPEARNFMMALAEAEYVVNVKAVPAGDPQEALARIRNAWLLLRQPPDQARWNTPMLAAWRVVRYELLSTWKSLAKHFPDDVTVRYNAGLFMLDTYKEGDEDAATHLGAAIESQRLPQSERGIAYKNLGMALMNAGRIAEAEAPLRAALEQSHPDVRAHCLLAEVYKQTKRFEEAARAAANCPELAPINVSK